MAKCSDGTALDRRRHVGVAGGRFVGSGTRLIGKLYVVLAIVVFSGNEVEIPFYRQEISFFHAQTIGKLRNARALIFGIVVFRAGRIFQLHDVGQGYRLGLGEVRTRHDTRLDRPTLLTGRRARGVKESDGVDQALQGERAVDALAVDIELRGGVHAVADSFSHVAFDPRGIGMAGEVAAELGGI